MKETAFERIMGSNATDCSIQDIKDQANYWKSQPDADTDEITHLETLAIEYIEENSEKFLMNPHTGTVQTESEWIADAEHDGWGFDESELIEVEQDENCDWVEI